MQRSLMRSNWGHLVCSAWRKGGSGETSSFSGTHPEWDQALNHPFGHSPKASLDSALRVGLGVSRAGLWSPWVLSNSVCWMFYTVSAHIMYSVCGRWAHSIGSAHGPTPKIGDFFTPLGLNFTESQNQLGWKRHPRPSSPTQNQSPPGKPNTKCHIQSSLKHLQWLHHPPGQSQCPFSCSSQLCWLEFYRCFFLQSSICSISFVLQYTRSFKYPMLQAERRTCV